MRWLPLKLAVTSGSAGNFHLGDIVQGYGGVSSKWGPGEVPVEGLRVPQNLKQFADIVYRSGVQK